MLPFESLTDKHPKSQPVTKKWAAIIGSNGYIGKHLVMQLVNESISVNNYDLQPFSADPLNHYEQLDVTNRANFEILPSVVDYIFFLAGRTGTSDSFDKYQSYVAANEIGLLNLLDWMVRSNCRARLVFPSTRLVYEGMPGLLSEDSALAPRSIYALNKLTCEKALQLYHSVHDVSFTILRLGVIYGNVVAGQYSYGTIGSFLEKATQGNDIELYGSGENIRTFTHIQDVCEVLLLCAETAECHSQVYNMIGEELSLNQIALKIASKYGINVKHTEWPPLAKKLESGDTGFDSAKLMNVLDFNPRYSFGRWVSSLDIKGQAH